MAESGRRADGSPEAWIPGGVSVSRGPEFRAAAASDNPTFNRTTKTPDTDQTFGSSAYMPSPFHPTLPKLGDRPDFRVYRDPPITTLDDFTIDDIRSALQAHSIGQFLSSARLADAMTGDDRIATVHGTRVKGVLGLPFEVVRRRRRKEHRAEAREARDVVKKLWDEMCPRPQVAEFLQWGIQMGFALAEVVWRERYGYWVPTLRTWHPQLVYYRYDERAYYAITMDGPVKVTPGDGKWVLYAPHGEYRGWMHGTVRTCASPWRYRTYGLRDWARHSEKHGFPWVLLRVPLSANDEDKQRFYASVNALGGEPTFATPQVDEHNRFDVDLLEAEHPAADVFEKLVTRCDTLISCAVLGQNLTTEIQGGSYAAATVHGQVRQDFLEADATTLAQCLEQQLLRPFCIWNFELGRRAIPSVGWDTRPPDDKRLTAQTVAEFAKAIVDLSTAGFPLDVEAIAKQFGVPVAQQDKDGASQGQLFQYHLQFGVVTVNEVRARIGLAPIPGGDVPPKPLVGPQDTGLLGALRELQGQVSRLVARRTA